MLYKGFKLMFIKQLKLNPHGLFIFLLLNLNPLSFAAIANQKQVTVTLFQWKFEAVAKECVTTLGPLGYGYAQISPPQEHIQGPQWWTSYQPVSYKIASRLGDEVAFKTMIDACHGAGVKVIVDAV